MKKSALAAIGLFLFVYIAPLGVRPLFVPDESRYAEIPRMMIESGDWTVPRLNGVRYFEKPVLGYWLTAISMTLFGENAFAVRLPSALAVGISSLTLFFMARRFSGVNSAGILSAVIFLTCGGVFGIGTSNVLDNAVSMFMTLSMVAFFFAHQGDSSATKNGFLVLAGISSGLAFLVKGFIAFAVPVVAIVPFLIWERRWKELLRVWWIPAIAACFVSLPWAIMIHIREPDYWHFLFWNEHIRRLATESAQHRESFLYFFIMFPALAMPWIFLFPAVVSGMKQMDIREPIIRYAICWFVFPFIFFSASSGNLGTYILPCFPPFAILMESGRGNYFERGGERAFRVGVSSLAVALGIAVIAFTLFQVFAPHDLRLYAQSWKWAMLSVAVLFMVILLLFAIRETKHQEKIMLYGAAPVLCMFIAPFVVPDQTMERKAPEGILLSHAHRIKPDSILVSDRISVSAVCWYYERRDVYLLGSAGELSHGMSYEDVKHRALELDEFRELILKHRGTSRVTLFERAKKYERQRKELPDPIFEDGNGGDGFVFVQF